MERMLRHIVADLAKVPMDFPEAASLRDDLRFDSLAVHQLVAQIERLLNTQVADDRFYQAKTFHDVVALADYLAARSSAFERERRRLGA